MADKYGAEISEAGIPVKTASDDQKVLDTRWRTLDIVVEPVYSYSTTLPTDAPGDNVTFGSTTDYITIYSHNLGFLPAFDYSIDTFTISDPNATSTPALVSDKNNIYFVPEIGSVNTSVQVTIQISLRIYNLPVTLEYQAPVVQSQPVTGPINSGYGAKFLKQNTILGDINEGSPDDYSFSTGLRPLNILQTGTVTVSEGIVQITYNYGVSPLYTMAVYYPNNFTAAGGINISGPLVGALSFAGGRGTITPTIITVQGVQSSLAGEFAYIIFKDPMDIAL